MDLVVFLVQREGVFFISGDVHFGEIARYNYAAGYPLYDITSSGLTQAVSPLLRFIARILAWLTPAIMRVKDKSCRYRSCT
uniref:PhoD-like phosphatase metallophosphatase domain-containing protein n=1 Tax=Solanum tuberosum TaxID=4113 RepID=M1CEU2_SOLTU